MGTRKQEGDSLLTVYEEGDERRVTFHRRLDGTFGFQEWRFSAAEDSWMHFRNGDGSRLSTLDDAIREAKGRVGWLGATMESQ